MTTMRKHITNLNKLNLINARVHKFWAAYRMNTKMMILERMCSLRRSGEEFP